MTITYRAPFADESQRIAEVHVAAWRSAYRGILPDDLLANLAVEERASTWRRVLSSSDSQTKLLIALVADEIVGFVAYGAARAQDDGCDAEIYALYVLSDHQHQGIGRQLVSCACADFTDWGMSSMVIWVLKDNAPARAFYQALGGSAFLEKTLQIAGEIYSEVGYVYANLAELAMQR